jgi:MFS transporter, NNP family, nitrate/nitrite transporter
MSENAAALRALVMSTVAFTVCFACWVLNAVLVSFLVASGVRPFDETEVAWLLAVPILTARSSAFPWEC